MSWASEPEIRVQDPYVYVIFGSPWRCSKGSANFKQILLASSSTMFIRNLLHLSHTYTCMHLCIDRLRSWSTGFRLCSGKLLLRQLPAPRKCVKQWSFRLFIVFLGHYLTYLWGCSGNNSSELWWASGLPHLWSTHVRCFL